MRAAAFVFRGNVHRAGFYLFALFRMVFPRNRMLSFVPDFRHRCYAVPFSVGYVVVCTIDAGYLHFLYIEISPYLGIAVFISTTLGDVELAVNSRNTAVPILTIGCINLIDDKQHSTNAIYLSCYNRNCLLLTYHISVHALFVKLRPYCPPH